MSITNGAYAWQVDEPEDWRQSAACAEVPPDVMFPEPGASTRDAKSICAVCPSVIPCLEEALENNEQFGVWGNTTPFERRKLSRGIRPIADRRPRLTGRQQRAWTPDELDELRRLNGLNMSDASIGRRIGRRANVVGAKRRELGLPARGKRVDK